MKLVSKITLGYIFIFIAVSCSTKSDFFMNRFYRYTVLRFNVMYNGQEALRKYEDKLKEDYDEDFFHILPLDLVSLKNYNPKDTLLNRAEQKARKGIQKHSMLIGNKEYNNYIDRSYLLLGKSLYYQEEYKDAVETFNYAKSHLKGFKEWINCCIWLEKSNIALGNYNSGESFMRDLLKDPNIEYEQKKEIYKLLVDSNIKKEDYQKSEDYLKELINLTKEYQDRYRYMFILAQILKVDNKKNDANIILNKIIEENPSDLLVLQSILLCAAISKVDSLNYKKILKPLFDILNEDINNKYQDMTFFIISNVYYKVNIIDSSLFFINKAITIGNEHQKLFETGVYYDLAEKCYFEKGDYLNAMKSCDNGIVFLKNRTKDKHDISIYQRLKKQKKDLTSIVKLINSYQEKDNIILLSSINKRDIENYITQKVREEQKKEKEKEIFNKIPLKVNKNIKNENSWYFYNEKLLELGQKKFKQKWGNIKLVDNWKIKQEEIVEVNIDTTKAEDNENIQNEIIIKQKVTEIISKIPNNQDSLKLLINGRNYEYYSVAILYRDQFKRPDLCINQLNKLLSFEPFEDLKLPSYYFLYKSYSDLNDNINANKYKDIILTKYGDSRYARIIQNHKSSKQEKTDEKLYYEIYNAYKYKNNSMVIKLCDEFESNFSNSDLSPKIALIRAYIYANNNIDEYISKLDFILFNYPGSIESEEAKILKENAIIFSKKEKNQPKYVKSTFQNVIILSTNEKYLNNIKEINFVFEGYETSFEQYKDITYILIKNLKNKYSAESDIDFLIERSEGSFTKNDIFVVSKLDYERFLNSQSLEVLFKK